MTTKHFKFSGIVASTDQLHQVTPTLLKSNVPDEHYIAPTLVPVDIVVPEKKTIGVPQYSPTVYGEAAASYNPAEDCKGNFMSSKFQPNNNCYAYGCNITPNTFPQPGRQSGYLLSREDFTLPFDDLGKLVSQYAAKDGLEYVGATFEELLAFKSQKQRINPEQLNTGYLGGHFVALMISTAGDNNWPGDYHWARCDNSSGACDSWSQKDGSDQVTNFDFAGYPIANPAVANWTVNQGPISASDKNELMVNYDFYCFMFVPESGVKII